MILTNQDVELITQNINLHNLETIGRTCYDSLDKITEDSFLNFFKLLLKNKHESILEHCSVTFKFKTNRAIANELVRHRIASYTQSSTRYIKYNKGTTEFIIPFKLKNNIIMKHLSNNIITSEEDLNLKLKQIYFKYHISSSDKDNIKAEIYAKSCLQNELNYKKWLEYDNTDQGEARDILPLGLATTLIMTCNLREFLHIYNLRVLGTTGSPHPLIKELISMAMEKLVNNEKDINKYAKTFFNAAI